MDFWVMTRHLAPYQSLFYLLLGNAIIVVAIYTPYGIRRLVLLLPTWVFLACSFLTLDQLPWSPAVLERAGTALVISMILWPVGLFTAEPLPIPSTKPQKANNNNTTTTTKTINNNWYLSLRQGYRIYNNPRRLPLSPSTTPNSPQTRLSFLLRQTFRILLLLTLKSLLRRTITTLFSTATSISDYSPIHEPLTSLFTLPSPLHHLTIRVALLLHWLTESILPLSIVHTVLSIFFVSLLNLDFPSEWPPLFASPLEAYSLRRFWGRFWHGLFSPGAKIWAQFLCRGVLRLQAGGAIEKVMVPFVVFTVSGWAHWVVGWRLEAVEATEGGGWMQGDGARDMWFFWVNFGVILGEVMVMKGLRGVGLVGRGGGGWVGRVVGYVWVVGFFLWVLPYYLFPKIYLVGTGYGGAGEVSGGDWEFEVQF